MAARIYADVAGNKCSCGGKFTKRIPHQDAPNFIVPKCDKCDSNPPVYLLDVDTVDKNGKKGREKVRHTQNGDRIDSAFRAIFTINEIIKEIENETFDLRKYLAQEERKSFKFSSVLDDYIDHLTKQKERLDVTPKYFKDQLGLIKREIRPFFEKFDVTAIDKHLIRRFKDSYTTKFTTRNKSLASLRTILSYAKDYGLINEKPDFDPIPRSSKRKDIISLELALKTVDLMHKEMYRDMYTLMLTYPMRPCEVRALKWFNIDLSKGDYGTVTVDHHFSDEQYLKGRKSIKEGECASLTWPLTEKTREIFLKYKNNKVMQLDWKNQYVFINRFGSHVSDETLRESWSNARKKAGHKFPPYVCRHRTATELYKKLGGDIVKLKKVGGWTNISTPGDTYVRPDDDMKGLF